MADVTTQAQLNDQLVLAINWTQDSGEYAAVAYQAYNLARIAFDQALASGVENPAVVLDLDETVLDNSAFQAGLIDTDAAYSSSIWNPWILAEDATAIPGAIEFINYVTANGGKVFFVSNRDESSTGDTNNNDLEQATIDNLIALGVNDVTDANTLVSGEFTGIVDGEMSESKEFRRLAVENGSADGTDYETVVLIGDNLNDFDDDAGTTNVDRRVYVESTQDQYGVYSDGNPAYIVLPNPQYGDWEGPGLYNPAEFGKEQWYELTPEEKNIQRKAALDVWDAPDQLEVGITSNGAQDRLNEQLVMALNWTQESGEFDALAYQSYAAAKLAFDQALASGVENPAVVLDLDETVLDNSLYQAWLVDKNIQYSSSTWASWILSEDATAVAGAIEFVNYVTANGGRAFYISDRDESSTDDTSNNDLEQATIDNLLALGLGDISDDNVLLRGEFTGIVDGEISTSKEYRRIAVESGSADGTDYETVVLVGDNLNDLDDDAGVLNSDRRPYVDSIQDRYGVYSEDQPAYIPLSNPQYGAWEQGLYDPEVFDKEEWFLLDPAEKNIQRQQTLTRWTTESGEVFTAYPATPDGAGGKNLFEFTRDDSLGLIVNFGGIGNSKTFSDNTIAESDILQFTGAGLTAENLMLIQRGTDVVVGFDGILDTQVLLKNINVEDLDNYLNNYTVGNILFNGETTIEDSFDVLDSDSTAGMLWNANTTTFLNDLDNSLTGLADSDDVINAQAGNDTIDGLSGNDTIRGGAGDDVLTGGDGDDLLAGDAGSDTVTGGAGSDRFVLAANAGTDSITDFKIGEDLIQLNAGITFEDLTIAQGTGDQPSAALVSITATEEVLAILSGIEASAIGSANFVAV